MPLYMFCQEQEPSHNHLCTFVVLHRLNFTFFLEISKCSIGIRLMHAWIKVYTVWIIRNGFIKVLALDCLVPFHSLLLSSFLFFLLINFIIFIVKILLIIFKVSLRLSNNLLDIFPSNFRFPSFQFLQYISFKLLSSIIIGSDTSE